jgi:hypothetical protein
MKASNDRRFWTALGEEVGPESYRSPGCDRKRIRQSVLCRAHHFEKKVARILTEKKSWYGRITHSPTRRG